VGSNRAGPWRGHDRALRRCLEGLAKRHPHLPPTPFAMLVEIGMTGRNPAYTEILDQVVERDPAEYKAAIRANPWLTNGCVPLEVQMDALKAVLPYLMSMPSTGEKDDSPQFPSDFWAKAAANDPILRSRIEMIILEEPPRKPPGEVS
jgi:hypothetical protein